MSKEEIQKIFPTVNNWMKNISIPDKSSIHIMAKKENLKIMRNFICHAQLCSHVFMYSSENIKYFSFPTKKKRKSNTKMKIDKKGRGNWRTRLFFPARVEGIPMKNKSFSGFGVSEIVIFRMIYYFLCCIGWEAFFTIL